MLIHNRQNIFCQTWVSSVQSFTVCYPNATPLISKDRLLLPHWFYHTSYHCNCALTLGLELILFTILYQCLYCSTSDFVLFNTVISMHESTLILLSCIQEDWRILSSTVTILLFTCESLRCASLLVSRIQHKTPWYRKAWGKSVSKIAKGLLMQLKTQSEKAARKRFAANWLN